MTESILGALVAYGILITALVVYLVHNNISKVLTIYRLHARLRVVESAARDRIELLDIFKEMLKVKDSASGESSETHKQVMVQTETGLVKMRTETFRGFVERLALHKGRLRSMRGNPYIAPLISDDTSLVFDVDAVFDLYPEYRSQADTQDDGELNPLRFVQWLHHHLVESMPDAEGDKHIVELRKWLDDKPELPTDI